MVNMSGIMSVEELFKSAKDEWALKEVREDKLDEPRKVNIIAANKNRDEIYEKKR